MYIASVQFKQKTIQYYALYKITRHVLLPMLIVSVRSSRKWTSHTLNYLFLTSLNVCLPKFSENHHIFVLNLLCFYAKLILDLG